MLRALENWKDGRFGGVLNSYRSFSLRAASERDRTLVEVRAEREEGSGESADVLVFADSASRGDLV